MTVAFWVPFVPVQAAQPLGQEDRARRERDATYEAYVRELESSPTTVVSYEGLLEAVRGYQVTVLGGYSGLDYELPGVLREQIAKMMRRKGDKSVYVLGGTEHGIGKAYRWIPELALKFGLSQIKTAGIVSRNAAAYGVPEHDYIVFVDTPVDNWEVLANGRSLMVDIAKQTAGKWLTFAAVQCQEQRSRRPWNWGSLWFYTLAMAWHPTPPAWRNAWRRIPST